MTTPATACTLNTSSIDFFVTNAASSPSTSNAATPQSSQSSSIPKAGRPLKEVFQPQLSSIGVSSPSGQAPAAKQPGRRNLSWSTHPDTSAVNIADADEGDWVNEGETDDEHYYESNVLEVTGKTKVEMAKKTGKMIEDVSESESKKGRPISISRQHRDLSPAPYDVETTTAAWSKVDASRHMALGATTSDGTGVYLAEKLRGQLLFFPQYNKLPGHQCTNGNARCSLLFNEQYRNAFINYLSKFREEDDLAESHAEDVLASQPPNLTPGEKGKEIIALFHDEISFHGNRTVIHTQIKYGQMPSRKKGRGRVIIVSDCILKATGFLEKKDDEGNVIERARRIICPGSQEDSWWTAQDVVKQGGRMPWPFHRYLLEDGQPKGLESVLQVRAQLFIDDISLADMMSMIEGARLSNEWHPYQMQPCL
ncbi:hypothetical protein LQV05_004258 [Cryptococcus neoformans]|nr:hypothetical protein LQV05_004258 [Cryptococcus neoformans]